MPKPINLREHEVRALLANGRVLVVRSTGLGYLNMTPNDWGDLLDVGCGGRRLFRKSVPEFTTVDSPFGDVGDMTWGREAFEAWNEERKRLVYRQEGFPLTMRHRWSPAQSMRREYSRFPRLRIESVRVMRVGKITEAMASATGVEPTLLFSLGGIRSVSHLHALLEDWFAHNPKLPFAETPWAWAVEVRNKELMCVKESECV